MRFIHRMLIFGVAMTLFPAGAWAQGRVTKEVLLTEYDLSDASVDIDEMLAPGVPRDGIPAITGPERVSVGEAEYPEPDGRVIEVVVGGEAVAYPIGILTWHEIVNDVVGGVPIAATYCPLCDSVSVLNRTLKSDDGETRTLEFGVSGLLMNSNVVMYERGTMGLWSQVAMRAVSGPDVGKSLEHLPVRVITFEEFVRRHPDGEVLTTNTGHERPYGKDPYQRYFDDPDRVFHEFSYDDRLPPKALGLGVRAGDETIFVLGEAIGDGGVTITTKMGDVRVAANEAGLEVIESPKGVSSLQTFYHSWAAFYPETRIVGELKEVEEDKSDDDGTP